MKIDSLLNRMVQGEQNQRDNDYGQKSMGCEDGQVNKTDYGRSLERGPASVEVVNQIRNKEDRRCGESSDHARAVGPDSFLFDEEVAEGQENGAGRIQAGIE